MKSRKIVMGNWKMNISSTKDAQSIVRRVRAVASKLTNTDVVICPSFVHLSSAISKRSKIVAVGAQSVSFYEPGSHTGEVSALSLVEMGVEYVIVGHSEERVAGDTDETVSKRAIAALTAGLKAVICIGEKTRDENGAYLEVLKEQMKASLAGIDKKYVKNIILAYEPVWAIGAPEPMAPVDIHETSIFIKKVFSDIFGHDVAMKTRVLYGGAVNFRNAADIISIGKVDGLLVGRESVNIPGFKELLKAVNKVNS